jgi:ABC-type dipeptide transport system, periplasmic component
MEELKRIGAWLLCAMLLGMFIPITHSQQVVTAFPGEMDPGWRMYFEQYDFDGDGVAYRYDRYLGRDDNTIDYAKKQGGTMTWMGADISTVDPIQSTDTASSELQSKVYEGLVQLLPGTTAVVPCLAKAWEIGNDGLVYTFYLREGVRFHDGSTFDADDVVFSIERFLDPSYASKRISFGTDYIDHVEKVNDYTVRFHLKNQFAPFLALLTYNCYYVLPKEYVEANERYVEGRWERDWMDKPIGTGAWVFEYYRPGNGWEASAYEDHWAGRPYLDSLRMIVNEEDETIVQAFKAGQIDWSSVPTAHWEEFNEQEPYRSNLLNVVTLSSYWLELNCGKWPFNNTQVSQAVACAMDREGVLETVFKGRHIPSHGPLPPGLFGFSQVLYDNYEYTYNPRKARALLDEAGAVDTDGDGIREFQGKPLEFEMSIYTSDVWREGGKTFVANLRDVGIGLRVQEYEFNTILDMTESGKFEMCSLGWVMDYPDPENFLFLWESKGIPHINSCRYVNPEVDELVERLRTETDPQKRREISYECEKIIRDDHPHIWFYHPRETTCRQPYLHNWEYGPAGDHAEKWLNVWKDEGYR